MVDKKVVAAGVAVLAAVGTGVALALRGDEAPTVDEGAPEGEVSLEITPQGMPEGFSFDDVKGAWGVGATINVNGVATAGVPTPSMLLELYDNDPTRTGPPRATMLVADTALTLNATYTLTEVMGDLDIGNHSVQGRMVLTNVFGSYEFTSDPVTFDIGEEPPGVVDIDVTLV